MTQTKSRTQECSSLLQYEELLKAGKDFIPAQTGVMHYKRTLDLNKSLQVNDQERLVCGRVVSKYTSHLRLKLGSQIEMRIHQFGKADLAKLATCQVICSEFGISVTNVEVKP